MQDNADFKEKEIELQGRLASHVDGELLAAGTATAGSNLVASYRSGPVGAVGLLDVFLIRKMQRVIARRIAERRNEEQDLPGRVWLALTADDLYLFPITSPKKDVQAPVRHWSRASLQSIAEEREHRVDKVVITLDSGKKAIFGLNFNSKPLQAHMREALGLAETATTDA